MAQPRDRELQQKINRLLQYVKDYDRQELVVKAIRRQIVDLRRNGSDLRAAEKELEIASVTLEKLKKRAEIPGRAVCDLPMFYVQNVDEIRAAVVLNILGRVHIDHSLEEPEIQALYEAFTDALKEPTKSDELEEILKRERAADLEEAKKKTMLKRYGSYEYEMARALDDDAADVIAVIKSSDESESKGTGTMVVANAFDDVDALLAPTATAEGPTDEMASTVVIGDAVDEDNAFVAPTAQETSDEIYWQRIAIFLGCAVALAYYNWNRNRG